VKLPKLKIVIVPDAICVRCSAKGYVLEKARLCLPCFNIAAKMYESEKRKEFYSPIEIKKRAATA
jgi:hypothetical protein